MGITRTILMALVASAATACGNPGDLSDGGTDGDAAALSSCSVTWVSDAPASRFTVTMPASAWVTGEHAYSGATATLELASGTYRVADGTFTLTIGELATGSPLHFADGGTHTVLDAANASAGILGDGDGDFFGTWQLTNPESAPSGSGELFAVVDSDCFDVGTSRSFATCE